MTGSAREGGDGNRIWRVDVAGGPVLQKLYGERGGWLHARLREAATRLRGDKTSTRAAGRRATEARLLALWAAAGCDVPKDLSARHPDLHHARTLVLEFVDGRLLSDLLADAATPDAEARAQVERYAHGLGRRHALAVERREAGLVHEHGGVQHVLVAGARQAAFDLENGFRPRRDVRPLVAKELAAALRSIARSAPARFDALLPAFVAAYAQPALLRFAADHYLHPRAPLWALVWGLDRRRERRRGRPGGKYRVLEALERQLDARA